MQITYAALAVQPPAPPEAPPPPPPTVVIPGVSGDQVVPLAGVPQTRQELEALEVRRSELSDQLQSAARRRDQLAEQLKDQTGASAAGLEQRIGVLDARIAQLETDIAETGRQLAAAPANLLAEAEVGVPGEMSSGQLTAVSIVGTVFIGFPIALAFARLIWKRATTPAPRLPAETTQRLERMEHAVDSIAIEVERVSEGQRFLTRLFTDPGQAGAPALGVGTRPAEPLPVGQAEGARSATSGS